MLKISQNLSSVPALTAPAAPAVTAPAAPAVTAPAAKVIQTNVSKSNVMYALKRSYKPYVALRQVFQGKNCRALERAFDEWKFQHDGSMHQFQKIIEVYFLPESSKRLNVMNVLAHANVCETFVEFLQMTVMVDHLRVGEEIKRKLISSVNSNNIANVANMLPTLNSDLADHFENTNHNIANVANMLPTLNERENEREAFKRGVAEQFAEQKNEHDRERETINSDLADHFENTNRGVAEQFENTNRSIAEHFHRDKKLRDLERCESIAHFEAVWKESEQERQHQIGVGEQQLFSRISDAHAATLALASSQINENTDNAAVKVIGNTDNAAIRVQGTVEGARNDILGQMSTNKELVDRVERYRKKCVIYKDRHNEALMENQILQIDLADQGRKLDAALRLIKELKQKREPISPPSPVPPAIATKKKEEKSRRVLTFGAKKKKKKKQDRF